MELASDLPTNDIDFDFDLPDASRAASAEPIQDVMVEDIQESTTFSITDAPVTKEGADDDMLDEDFADNEGQNPDESMDHEEDGQNSATMYDDEDLIYEDDEVIEKPVQEPNDVDIQEPGTSTEEEAAPANDESSDANQHTAGQSQQDQPFLQENNHQTDAVYEVDDTQREFDALGTRQEELIAQQTDQGDSNDLGSVQQPMQDSVTSNTVPEEPKILDDLTAQPEEMNERETLTNNSEVPGLDTTQDISHDEAKDDIPGQHDPYEEARSEKSESTAGTLEEYESQALHPVKVQYDGAELCLFPPLDGEDTFFVQDSSLAFSSCQELLGACREVLGDSIQIDRELVLDFPSLGLHLAEVCPPFIDSEESPLMYEKGSSHTSQLTVAQILDVYLALHQNEQAEATPPLQCILSTRLSLSSQYAFLVSAAENGKTLSSLHQDYSDRFDLTENVPRSMEAGPSEALGNDSQRGVAVDEKSSIDVGIVPLSEADPARTSGSAEAGRTVVPSGDTGAVEDEDNLDAKSDISSELDLGPEMDSSADHKQDLEEEPGADVDDNDDSVTAIKNDLSRDTGVLASAAGPVPEVPQDVPLDSTDQSAEPLVHNVDEGISVNDFALSEPQNSTLDESNANHLDDDTNETAVDSSAENEQVYEDADVNELAYDVDAGENKENVPTEGNSDPQSTVSEDTDDAAVVVDDVISETLQDSGDAQTRHDSEHTLANEDLADITSTGEGEALNGHDMGNEADTDIFSLDDDIALNAQTSKRKLQDEDDYGLMGPATPEKKKRRPS